MKSISRISSMFACVIAMAFAASLTHAAAPPEPIPACAPAKDEKFVCASTVVLRANEVHVCGASTVVDQAPHIAHGFAVSTHAVGSLGQRTPSIIDSRMPGVIEPMVSHVKKTKIVQFVGILAEAEAKGRRTGT